MRHWNLRQLLLAFVLAAATQECVAHSRGSAAPADKDDEGFQDLFNGKDFTGWKTVLVGNTDPDKTWSVKDGVIICTGHPNGYFYTEKSYKNYVFRYDWRYKRPEGLKAEKDFKGNSGCLIHIQEPHKVWPKCVEVQGENLRHGILIFLYNKEIGKSKYDQKTKDQVTHPVGEWNTTEIFCKDDGSIIAKINGTEVSSGKGELTEGQIGFQSEGAEIHFRNIKIKELK
jgi:hypothetical protein